MSLSMVLQGASGETKTELEQNINADKPLNVDDYHSLNLSINGKYEGKSEMKTANGVWVNKNTASPSEQLKQSIKSGFDGTIKTTDFNEDIAKQMSS
jgi:serine protease inhibitor